MPDFDKIVVVTKRTQLEELVERFNTREQARFYLEHAGAATGASYEEYQAAHDTYHRSLDQLRNCLPKTLRSQWIERGFLPTFTFGPNDLVITIGPDGLVVNTAKYLGSQPLLPINPDQSRVDGILVTFPIGNALSGIHALLRGQATLKRVSMARAELNDGQALHALNDLFIGARTHLSARYRLSLGKVTEHHSSSGIIVSTGAGSTGWLRSVLTGAAGVVEALIADPAAATVKERYQFDWEADHLRFAVREPFVSKLSSAQVVFGDISVGTHLELVSQMPQHGVIFSDGVEEDFLEFNSGAVARITLAERKLNLVTQ